MVTLYGRQLINKYIFIDTKAYTINTDTYTIKYQAYDKISAEKWYP